MRETPGQRFGRWVILAPRLVGSRMAFCRCDCGTERYADLPNLVRGMSTSCGCYRREYMATLGRARAMDKPATYAAIHMRLMRARGAASAHQCVDCGQPAKDWSLRWDAEETFTAVAAGRSGRSECLVSADLDDYEPRCRKCHVAYDKLTRSGDLPENRVQG